MPIIVNTDTLLYPYKGIKMSKYIDLIKFLSLLAKKSVFFCRLDKLEDKFEGLVTRRNFDSRIEWYEQANSYFQKRLTKDEILAAVNQQYEYDKKVKEVTCVCCWNKSEDESAALWKIYSDFGKGIMIKTSVERLEEAFVNTIEDIYISEIRYLNYDKDLMPDGNTFYPIIHKQRAYKYEEEIRLIYEVDNPQIGRVYDWDKEEIKEGKLLKVDLNSLIEEIIIGPFSPEWMIDLISDLVDKYDLNKPIRKSKLSLL